MLASRPLRTAHPETREVDMHEGNLLAAWESFYVIVGSSAAALTGLQFVVMALVAESERSGSRREIAAFGSPTVVHFCSALLVSALFSAPWPDLAAAGRAGSLIGLAGLVYAAIVLRRARGQRGYQPVFEDWLWHTILPAVAYLALLVSGLLLAGNPGPVLFGVGAAALGLVFIGIHNAWDTVIYIAIDQKTQGGEAPAIAPASALAEPPPSVPPPAPEETS
jgi:hypothetical protein